MKSLFDSTELAGMKLKNRCVRSATHDRRAAEDGHMTAALFRVYEDLAKGGAGLIITGLTYVSDKEQSLPHQMGIYDDSFIEEYANLTGVCHKYDAKIVMQLACVGSQTFPGETGKVIWGPSAVEDLGFKVTPAVMTTQDILFVQAAFADAALRAKKSGFDGIQLHVAHGYLLSKFLTPYYNRRTDAYGGSIGNRTRMILETYAAVRKKVGPDYPVLVKINSEDFMDQGLTFAECKYVCKELVAAGIDAIEISGGSRSSRPNEWFSRTISPDQQSYFLPHTAELAGEVDVPVILVGGNRDYASLTDILNKTSIEYIAFCRPLIRESDLINRWQFGDREPSACVFCNKCFHPGGTSCVFNRPPDTDA